MSRSTHAALVDQPLPADAGLLRYIGERAVAVVVVELVAAIGGDIKVLESVVIVVADGNAHAVAGSLQAGFFRNVFECAIFLLMVEAIPVLRIRFSAGSIP